MNAEVTSLVDLARESMAAARALRDRGHFRFSVSRSYYTMFYLAQAILLSKGLTYSSHGAVVAAFGREFVKPGLVDKRFHRFLRKAFEDRQRSDYDPMEEISTDLAETTLRRSEEFLHAATLFLSSVS